MRRCERMRCLRERHLFISGVESNEFTGSAAVHRECLADIDYRAAAGLRAHPQQISGIRSGLGAPWLHGSGHRADGGLVPCPAGTAHVGRSAPLARLTPLLLVDIPGELPECVLLYGHLDKQPEFTGWLPGLGPWEPVIRDGKLYGRGGADDGYAVFSSLTAIAALKAQAVPLPRCVLMIEATEESGSIHLPAHLDALGARIGEPSLVVCLDAECGNFEQLWTTTSLRGNLVGTLKVRVLTEGAHSGLASGIAPTPFRLARAAAWRGLRIRSPAS